MIEQLAKDPWFQAIGALQFVGSIGALILVIGRWRRTGSPLQYEPRRPVPWGPIGAILAVAFTALSISSALATEEAAVDSAAPRPQQIIVSLVASMVMQLLGPTLLLFIAAASNAKWSDIGLPSRSATAWMRDISIGLVACLAAVVPVGLVNFAIRKVMDLPNELTKHPLVEMLTKGEPEFGILALATLMAVVVAPIAEEITYRLLLQGWLEKWEDNRLGWRQLESTESSSEALQGQGSTELPPEFADDSLVESTAAAQPPKQGVGGLPYGWAPIILSSLLFAAAHYGYGPEPVPLFVLALVLGYCYQRTHRIVPCIVAHGLFNLLSMVALWRVVFINAG
jgi:membrane protease YdiL (CAAX protease family)